MIRTILFAVCLVVLGQVSAQTRFKVIQSENNNQEVVYADQELKSSDVVIKNLTNDSLSLTWERVKLTFPSDWSFSMCEYGRCYVGIPPKSDVRPQPPGVDGFIKLHLDPEMEAGEGELHFKVYETNKPEEYAIIKFNVTAISPKKRRS